MHVTEATALNGATTEWTEPWYVVSDTVTLSTRVTVTGQVNLILSNGAELNARQGITVSGAENGLTIWAQTEGVDETTGKLTAAATSFYNAAIGGGDGGYDCGDLTFNGGVISAEKSGVPAAIGSSTHGTIRSITVNFGQVTASTDFPGSYGAAIGGGDGGAGENITITGGTVIATARRGAGIGGGADGAARNITISGGTVTATSTEAGAGIGGGAYGAGDDGQAHDIRISGGTVVAKGGAFTTPNRGANGIGGGNLNNDKRVASSSNIVISDGARVTAYGGCEGIAAFGGVSVQEDYIHATFGSSEPDKADWTDEFVEWTGSSSGFGGYCSVKVVPMTVSGLSIRPENGAQDYYGVPVHFGFTAVLNAQIEGNPASLEGLRADECVWTITGLQSSASYVSGSEVYLGSDETATRLTVRVEMRDWSAETYFTLNKHDVTYLDTTDGDTVKTVVGPLRLVDGDLNADASPTLNGENGWYYLPPDQQLTVGGSGDDQKLTVKGHVNLVLADNSYVSFPYGIRLEDGASLTIWGQENQSGILEAGAEAADGVAGIQVTPDAAGLHLNGGKVVAYGGENAAGIGGGDEQGNGAITIHAGTVEAYGGADAAAIGAGRNGDNAKVAITGGTVTARSDRAGRAAIPSVDFGEFIHATYASTMLAAAYFPEECTGMNVWRSNWSWVKIQPMEITGLAIQPEKTEVRLDGSYDERVKFDAMLSGKTADGGTFTILLADGLRCEGSKIHGDAASYPSGFTGTELRVAYDEMAPTLTVTLTVGGRTATATVTVIQPELTVTFQPGYGAAPIPTKVVRHQKVSAPADVTREGWSLNGWKAADDAENWNFDNIVPFDLTLEAVWVDDIAPESATVSLGTSKWKEFLHKITFGLFFKETQTMTFEAQDLGSGVDKTEYFLSDHALTEAEVGEWKGWNEYKGGVSLEPNQEVVAYFRVTDKAGNTSLFSSNGIVLDSIRPAIDGIEDGKYYNSEKTVTVSDAYLNTTTVTRDGADFSVDGTTFVLTEDGSYTVTVTDKAGNDNTVTAVIDRTFPVISGAENGSYSNAPVDLTVSDANLDAVTVTRDGEPVDLTDQTNFRLEAEGEYHVTATDKAGNKSELTVTVDTTAPSLKSTSKLKEGGEYCLTLSGTFDEILDRVVVNGKPMVLGGNKMGFTMTSGSLNAPIFGELTIEAYDLAGNVLTIHVTLNAAHKYDELIEHVDPDCLTHGYDRYRCTVCGVATLHNDLGLGDHDWNEPEFTWSQDGKQATAHFTCARDESHTQEQTCEATAEVVTPADCETEGVTRYTVQVELDGETYTATEELADVPATGHTYQDGVCTVCGEADPDFQPAPAPQPEPEPEQPEQQAPAMGEASALPAWTALLLASAALLLAALHLARRWRGSDE